MLELVIPAEALPQQLDGQAITLRIHEITSGLGRGFRNIKELSEIGCHMTIPTYGYTKPAYSINPETGLACVILMSEDLQDFSPESAKPASISINKSWFGVPAEALLPAQRFLKYVLSPNWQPIGNLA